MKYSIFLLVLWVQTSFASTTECPNLTGVFDCKKDDPNYGAMFMQLTQSQNGNENITYHFQYRMKKDHSLMTLDITASNEGVMNPQVNNLHGVCSKNGTYLTSNLQSLANSARNEIDADGNFRNVSVKDPTDIYLCERIF